MKAFIIDKIEEIAFSRVEPEDSLWESGVLDSITIVELATELEVEYDVNIPFDEIITDNFETVARIVNYLNRKKA
jgi:acyl carrier protein